MLLEWGLYALSALCANLVLGWLLPFSLFYPTLFFIVAFALYKIKSFIRFNDKYTVLKVR